MQLAPVSVLLDNTHLLPTEGDALDLACGTGRNALWLAANHLRTAAWDTNQDALQSLTDRAEQLSLTIATDCRDCEKNPPATDSIDVLVVSHFLYRPIMSSLIGSLRKSGLIFYETFTAQRPETMNGPSNPDYLLDDGELLTIFSALDVLFLREERLQGDINMGSRGQAQIVARKR